MNLASPFVKGGSRGILLSNRLLIFNNKFLIDQISPNPSLLKRGNKKNTFTVSRAESQQLVAVAWANSSIVNPTLILCNVS